MLSRKDDELSPHAGLLEEEINHTLDRGSRVAAILGLSSGLFMVLAATAGRQTGLRLPAFWAIACSLFAFCVHMLARRKLVRGGALYAVILSFVSLPALVYLAAHFLLPSGAATYITGPPSYLYLFLIIVSGFAFDARLARFAGLLAGAQYLTAYWMDRSHLAALSSSDPLLLQDLTSPVFYVFKALMMVFSGFLVGVLGDHTKRLFGRIMSEENEKRSISRLFGQFVSPEVKDKIISEKAGLIGEKKSVAVLFSDVRAFTTFSEATAPEVVVQRLNEYFDAMVRSITSNGGVVDKFIGDAVMAVFGGVLPNQQPCESALSAAFEMRRSLQALNAKWNAAGVAAFDNGIGIHYGVVLQGAIGSADRKDFTIIGDTVNTASRVEGLCKEFGRPILLTGAVYGLLSPEGRAKCSPLGESSVKGKLETVEVFSAAEQLIFP